MITVFIAAVLALAGPQEGAAPERARIVLPTEAQVSGTSILLGDIAEISGAPEEVAQLAGFSLGYAPSPGYVRVLRGWRIEQTLERDIPGLDVEVAGSPAVRVHPITAAIEPQALLAAARAALAERFQGEDATLEPQGTIAPIEVPAGSSPPELKAIAANVRTAGGLATVPVRVLVDGELYRTVWTQWQIRLWETRPVLLRDVRAGEVIELAAIENRRVPLGSSRIGEAVPAGLLIGSVAARDLAVGATVDPRDVRRPLLIDAGDALFIAIRKGPITARVPVTALEAGALGDRVRVRTETGRELTATVAARNLVELDLSSAPTR